VARRGAGELLAGVADEAVESGAVRALDAVLELGVDVESRLGFRPPSRTMEFTRQG
jgi:hypothetical protein